MIKLWHQMHLLVKIGLIVDWLSLAVFCARLAFDGPFIMIPIQLLLLGVAIILIATGSIIMRDKYYEENQ